MSSTRGAVNVPFTSMVTDTIKVHGLHWAVEYYYKHPPAWQARFFIRAALGV
jgi:hypothetical protein